MSSTPYAIEADVCIVRGAVGTGKTEWLARRMAEAMRQGAAASDILAFAATPTACARLRGRLSDLMDDRAELPLVTTMREYALSLLGMPAAVARTGRQGRILMRFEENVLMEDMKTSGIQPRRLSEMLKFFYRSIADLEPMDSEWFYNDEERKAFGLLGRLLAHYSAYLEDELARTALQLVSTEANAFASTRRAQVFVDDYQMLSKASQCLAGALAVSSLVVAADDVAKIQSLEHFPCHEGARLLAEANPRYTEIELAEGHQAQAVASALNLLIGDPALAGQPLATPADADEGAFELIPHARPHDEFEGVAKLVADELTSGTAPDAIGVVVPNGIWARNISSALAAQNVPVARPERLAIGCDVRDLERCDEARAVTLLALAANPHDQLALRCWCGFGSYLANSGLFAEMASRGRGISLEGGVAAQDGNALLDKEIAKVTDALANARASLDALAGLVGPALVRAAWAEVATGDKPLPAWLSASAKPNSSAADIVEALRTASALPSTVENGVFVGQPDAVAGMGLEVVVAAGLVNGLTPQRSYFDPTAVERDKRPALLSREAAKIYCTAGKASRRLALSYFGEALLGDAERLKLKVFRVRLIDGQRVCEIRPSETIRAITGVYFDD